MGKDRVGARAISPIVATVLIVAVTLVASVAVAGFVFGVFGSSANSAQVAVTGGSLKAADFLSANSGVTFTCGATAGSFLTLTNTGTAGSTVTAATITVTGAINSFSLATGSSCNVGASGSASSVLSLLFVAAKVSTSPVAGNTFIGTVTLSSGAVLLFTGQFQ